MKKLLLVCLVLIGCGPPVSEPPPAVEVATVHLTDYQYSGAGIYYYFNDCSVIYYNDGTYNAACTYPIDNIIQAEVIRIGNNLYCPGPSYRKIEYTPDYGDSMDYTVNCE